MAGSTSVTGVAVLCRMGDITIKSLFREDLQRFKMARDDGECTLSGVRAKLEAQHRGMLPPNFVIKYEWGECRCARFVPFYPSQGGCVAVAEVHGADRVCARGAGKGLQELTTDAQLEAVIKTLAEAGNSPLRLYLSGALPAVAAVGPRCRSHSACMPDSLACAAAAPEPGGAESAPAPKAAAAAPRLSQSTANGEGSPRTPADLRPTPRPRLSGVSPLVATSSASAPCERQLSQLPPVLLRSDNANPL